MNKTFGLLFYVKKSKMLTNGTAPIYLRITIDGLRADVSSKRYVNPAKWNANGQKLNGSGDEVRTFNAYLKTLEHEVYEVHRNMIERKLPLTAVNLKNLLVKKDEVEKGKMLVPVFTEHKNQVKALIGKEFAQGTYGRYKTSLKHTGQAGEKQQTTARLYSLDFLSRRRLPLRMWWIWS